MEVVVAGFGTGVGKRVACVSEFWSLVSPLGGSPSETFLSCTHTSHLTQVTNTGEMTQRNTH